MRAVCHCSCHADAMADKRMALDGALWELAFQRAQEAKRFRGVDVTDVLEAAVACPECLNAHAEALLERRIWSMPPVSYPPFEASPDATDGDEGEE